MFSLVKSLLNLILLLGSRAVLKKAMEDLLESALLNNERAAKRIENAAG